MSAYKNISETVWSKNGIPPLEFCSLSRACELLGCDIEDLWTWQQLDIIRFAVSLRAATPMNGVIVPKNEWEMDSLEKDDIEKYRFLASLFFNQHKGFTYVVEENEIEGARLKISGMVEGVLEFNSILKDKDEASKYHHVLFRLEEFDGMQIYIKTEPTEIFPDETNNLLLTRRHIERIFEANKNGDFKIKTEATLDEPQPKDTVHQFNVIVSLLKIIGISDDEIFKAPPAQLNKKLSELAAKQGTVFLPPDKSTWTKWRHKYNR